MDFAILPPEINSARMYAGAGSGPMLAAASAWEALAAELHSTASAYQSAISGLTAGPWLGPASTMMAAAAAPYVTWMRTTAAQADQTARQALAAAAAYEAAFAATVPPPVVAANRSLLTALVATNFFGQNTSAIAATETQYSEMWAQDTGAMQSYSGASAAATRLQRFNAPASNTDTGGETEQADAVSRASGISGGNVQNALEPFSAAGPVPAAAPAAAPASALNTLALAANLLGVFVDPPASVAGLAVDSTALPYDVVGAQTGFHTDDIVSGWAGIQTWPGMAPVPPSPFPVINNLGPQASTVSAGLADATSVGRMSVPATWAAAAPEFRLSALALPALPATTIGAAAEASVAGSGSLFSQMALASMAGRAMAGTTGTGGQGLRDRIGAAAGKSAKPGDKDEAAQALPGGPITGISAELRELFALRDAGILTAEEFAEQKQRLLPH